MSLPSRLPILLVALCMVAAGLWPEVPSAQMLASDPDLGLMEAHGRVDAIAVQPDGKVVIGGDFTHVNGVRRNNIRA